MVDDEVGRDQRIHARGIAAQVGHGIAHRRQVDDGRDPVKSWRINPRRHEGDLGVAPGARPPRGQDLHVGRLDDAAARVAEDILEEDLDGHRGTLEVDPIADGGQPIDGRQARPERAAGAERIVTGTEIGPSLGGYTRRVQAYPARARATSRVNAGKEPGTLARPAPVTRPTPPRGPPPGGWTTPAA